MPLRLFARYLADTADISVVIEERLDEVPVTLTVKDVPLSDFLGVLSRRVGVQVTRVANLFFIGTLRTEDRGVLVRRIGELSKGDLSEAVGTLLSEAGRVLVTESGLAIVADRVEVLSRVHELIEAIEKAPSDSWVVQLHLVKMTRAAEQRLGVNVQPLGSIALTYATSGGTGIEALASLDTLLKADRAEEGVDVIAQPMFLLVDGTESEVSDASEIPIRKAIFDENRNLVSEDIEFRQVGLTVKVQLREVAGERARLEVGVEQSSVREFLADAPIIDTEKLKTVAVVGAGGVYLLGALEQNTKGDDRQGVFGLEFGKKRERSRVQIWARVYRAGALTKGGG